MEISTVATLKATANMYKSTMRRAKLFFSFARKRFAMNKGQFILSIKGNVHRACLLALMSIFSGLLSAQSLRVGAERAHMHQPLHTGLPHRAGDALGQLHMHAFKAGGVAMQHGDQVDHRIVPSHQALE